MNKTTVLYLSSKDTMFDDVKHFFVNQKLPVISSLTELFFFILESDKPLLDIYFLSHGFNDELDEDELRDYKNIYFQRSEESKLINNTQISLAKKIEDLRRIKINQIVAVLDKVGGGKLENVLFIACNTRHEVKNQGKIKRIISYKKSVHYCDLLNMAKTGLSTLGKDDFIVSYDNFKKKIRVNHKGIFPDCLEMNMKN